MFDVMLIDDEIDVCERLISIIRWEGLQLRLVAQAADSDTARELYLLHRPKIIITDINIPIISGLDLAEEFIQLDPEVRIIIITGHDDFAFAQKAVNIGAVEVLLKPIFADGINQSLEKAILYFEKQREIKTSVESLEKLLSDHLPSIREAYLADLLHSGTPTNEDVHGKFRDLGIECSGPYYTVALLRIDRDQNHQSFEAVSLLAETTVRSLMSKIGLQYYGFFDSHFRINCIIGSEEDDVDDLLEETFGKLISQLAFIADLKLYAGIGCSVASPAELHSSYMQALATFRYQNILSYDEVLHYKNISHYEFQLPTQQSVMKYLLNQFRLSHYDEFENAVTRHFTYMSTQTNALRLVRESTLEILAAIGRESSMQGVDIEQGFAFPSLLSELFFLNQPQDILERLLQITHQLIQSRIDRRTISNNYLISRAKTYIQENLQDKGLCLDSVSNAIGLSRVYFCNLFHKEAGITFSSYIKQIRVEKAKGLLHTSNMKVFEISEEIGFSNAKYFGYVFKQLVGLTPIEYQNSQQYSNRR